jgi:thiamine biosynthesis protein ThiS
MNIFLNGERVACEDAQTVAELLQERRQSPGNTLVEHNGIALRSREWPNQKLAEGDRLEILQVAAGG